jgi:hypothetical protein
MKDKFITNAPDDYFHCSYWLDPFGGAPRKERTAVAVIQDLKTMHPDRNYELRPALDRCGNRIPHTLGVREIEGDEDETV